MPSFHVYYVFSVESKVDIIHFHFYVFQDFFSTVLYYIHIIIDINECASNPGLKGATCNDLVNGKTCSFIPEYTGTNCGTSKSFLALFSSEKRRLYIRRVRLSES